MSKRKIRLLVAVIAVLLLGVSQVMSQSTTTTTSFQARDPGVRGGSADAGGSLGGLTAGEQAFFDAGFDDFKDTEVVADGLGPRFNLASCAGCHAQPAIGGTSPGTNPQFAVGGINVPPSFITQNGPIREARFKRNPDGSRDGGVHALFVITGLDGAAGCNIAQENFENQVQHNNVIFRIPTPTFGAGLIEMILDRTIVANQAANASAKKALGISGHPNQNGNDGTIARFGWKAQNKSLLLFSGEAYNVEMGITNELFQTERDETPSCQFAKVPNDVTDTAASGGAATISAIEKFAFFMRFLAAPIQSLNNPGGGDSINRGRQQFSNVGCALCHTPTLPTGDSTVAALRNQNANLFSDLLVHKMGPGLADEVAQGMAGLDEFRTAPLWGLGQRIFFLHDGRTTDLLAVIQAHKSAGNTSFGPSEANAVVNRFNTLAEQDKQDVLNFLRSL
jgi:CxxC motif-containing protein (DUF1111 family)